MYCHLCQEPRPEEVTSKEKRDKHQTYDKKDLKNEISYQNKQDSLTNFKVNNCKENFVNNSNQSVNLDKNNYYRKNISQSDISKTRSFYSNDRCNQTQLNDYIKQNDFALEIPRRSIDTNINQAQDRYRSNYCFDANNFNNNLGIFTTDYEISNNNFSNYTPNNLAISDNNKYGNHENFPYQLNHHPNNSIMFPNTNDQNYMPNNNLQYFPNLNQLPPNPFINDNDISNADNIYVPEVQLDPYICNENIRNSNYQLQNYSEKEKFSTKEHQFINKKRKSEILVDFENEQRKKYSGTGAKNLEYVKIGDWICRRCDNVNFSYRLKCHRCKSFIEDVGENINSNKYKIKIKKYLYFFYSI